MSLYFVVYLVGSCVYVSRYRGLSVVDEVLCWMLFFFFQAKDGIGVLVRSRGLGDVYKRQILELPRRAKMDVRRHQRLACARRAGDEHARIAPRTPIHLLDKGPEIRGGADHGLLPQDRLDVAHPFAVCLLYTSDAADERSSVGPGGRRNI